MDIEIRNFAGEKIDYSFDSGSADSHKDGVLVVMGHGVTGNKDRAILTETAKALNAAGFDTLRFSFAGNGDSEGDFRDCMISKEVGDLGSVLDAVSGGKQVVYIGHSMGGAVGAIRTSQDDRINALVSLAGMVDTKAFAETEFGEETPDEGLMWEEESCPLSSTFMNDLTQTVVNVSPQAEKVSVPWLLVHGTADDVVLPKDSETIKSLKGDSVDHVVIEGGDHVMSEAPHMAQASAAVVAWSVEKFG